MILANQIFAKQCKPYSCYTDSYQFSSDAGSENEQYSQENLFQKVCYSKVIGMEKVDKKYSDRSHKKFRSQRTTTFMTVFLNSIDIRKYLLSVIGKRVKQVFNFESGFFHVFHVKLSVK